MPDYKQIGQTQEDKIIEQEDMKAQSWGNDWRHHGSINYKGVTQRLS